jgi:transcriptional regulator with XRE-family HTH domain
MALMRRELGDVLRRERQRQQRTLRQVCATASVSPGYLSEIERGEKEASSELLKSICDALGVRLSHVLLQVAHRVAHTEDTTELAAPVALPVTHERHVPRVSVSAA